jgi:hypothetical protein
MVAFIFRLDVWNRQKASWFVDLAKSFNRTVCLENRGNNRWH